MDVVTCSSKNELLSRSIEGYINQTLLIWNNHKYMHDTEDSGKILAQITCEQPPCVGFELGLSVPTNKLGRKWSDNT